MAADWRVTVRLSGVPRASRAALRRQVADGIRDRLGPLADVSAGDSGVFVYAETEAIATEAAQVARDLTGQHGLLPEVTLDRWNPLKREWDDDTEVVSLPAGELADADHRHQVAEDTQRSQDTGVAQWTVRVTLSSRRDAVQLAGWLGAEGLPAVRRRRSVVLGATNEDVARDLAQRAAEQVPAAEVNVERTFVWVPPVDFGSFGSV